MKKIWGAVAVVAVVLWAVLWALCYLFYDYVVEPFWDWWIERVERPAREWWDGFRFGGGG